MNTLLKPSTTNPQIDRLLSTIVERLTEQPIENKLDVIPEKIYLFGSHTWGTPNQDSDLDLLIIIDNSNLSPAKRASLFYRCLRNINYPLDILVRTHQEIAKFANLPMSLEHQILSKGKLIYG
ncbi:MAG: nucleotidyltransferase domain-containing protein [Pseudanabaena sp. ELA748]